MPYPRIPVFLPLFALVWFTVAPAAAQVATTPRAAGFAGAFVALARGHEAADWNPANLGLPGQPPWSVAVPNLALMGAAGGPPLGELRMLLRSDLSESDRRAFLDLVPNAGLDFRGDVHVPWFGASVGRLAFGVSSTALVDVHATRGMVDMYLEARQEGRLDVERIGDYRVDGTAFRGAVLSRAVVAYGHPVSFLSVPASVGVAARAVVGHGLREGRIYDPVLDLENLDVKITMLAMGGPTGYGFGFDVGLAAQPLRGLTVGLSVENLVQTMTWRGRLEVRGGEFTDAELADMEPADFADRFEPRPYVPELGPPEADALANTILQGAMPPRIVRLGTAYEFGGTAVGVTFSQTAGSGRLHAGWPMYLAAGAEQRLWPSLRVRGGVATSLSGATAVAIGSSVSMGAAQLTLAAVRASGGEADAAPGLDVGIGFPDRLAQTTGYTLLVGLDVRKAPPPPRRNRRS
ncbi:MAG: hypothetical protein DIU52_002285 [bacterium]|jgi:hypothetical protein